ncbi:response regulator [Catenovulum sp. SM1970]|uniref:ATP-binding protein n=1 Tax=Marinifaba aquimaris TaxID=2741323 RepID=UPI0015730D54|nr:ATP-binding protein [Marinifaba aquimaris]NTS76662.1 response regulator [Marinifaba aquimaris]
MFNRSIKANAVIYAVIPTLVTAIALTSFLMNRITHERETLTAEQAHSLIEAIAFASEDNLVTNNRRNLQTKLREIHSSSTLSIDKIAIYDDKGHLFVASNYQEASPVYNPIKLKGRTYFIEQKNEKIIASRGIYPFEDNRLDDSVWAKRNVADSFSPPLGYVYIEADISRSLYFVYRTNMIIFAVILIGTAFTAVMMLLLIRRIANPIISIVDTVQAIGAGKLSARIDIPVQHELNDLKVGINMMAAELQENQEKLEAEIIHATQDLQQNLQLVEEKNAELDIARKEAQEGNQIKSQFLATMSHEIRTPLNAILGFTRELSRAELQEPYQDYVDTINSSADHLVTIVNDILDFSKLEAGKMELDASAYNLATAMEDVINLLSKDAYTKGLEIYYDATRQPEAVIGDQHRFKQILSNLLSNAIKFTHKGSVKISTQLECESNTQCTFTLIVADTGIGISQDKQKKLFSAFNQAEASTARRFGGTGLGLAITQGLVKQMNGKIELDSTPGQGTRFIVTLPITTAQKPEMLQKQAGLEQVLVLDHNLHISGLYEHLFEQVGAQVIVHTDISAWENELREHHFDLIILASDLDEETLELMPLQASFANKLAPNSQVICLMPPLGLINQEHKHNLAKWRKIEKPFSLNKLTNAWHQAHIEPEPQEEIEKTTEPNDRVIHMLAVDDNEINLKLLATILADESIELTTCTSGEDAIIEAQKMKFDLILMDVQMPVMDGVETTQHIREIELNTSTPIIAFTAHAFKDERDMLLRQGMDDYLPKPIDMAKFDALVKKWVDSEHISQPKVAFASETVTTGIDWSLSLQMANNRHDVALEMLTLLVDTFNSVKQEVTQARDTRDKDELLKVVHKFHGSTCYTGVPKLKALAFSIESQLKKGVIIDIDEQIAQLFSEMDSIRSSLEQISAKETA